MTDKSESAPAVACAVERAISKKIKVDISLLRSLAESGAYRTEIGKRLGVDPTTAADHAKKHGIVIKINSSSNDTARKWWGDRIDLMLSMRDEGMSFSSIALKLGTTKSAVAGKLSRLGKCKTGGEIRDSEFWKECSVEMLRLHAEGWSDRRIGKHLGVPHGTIYSRRKTLDKRVANAPRPKIEFPPYGHCLFPSGDVPYITFCGALLQDIGKPYCAACCRKAYLPPRVVDTPVSRVNLH